MSTEIDTTGLTPEEIEALGIDDGDTTATQGELEDQAAAGGATTTEEDDDDADKQGKADDNADAGTPGAEGDAAPVASAEQPAAAAADEPSKPSSAAAQAPLLVATAPEDAEQKLADIASQKAELRKKYDDGDLTFDEYEGEKDTLVKQERDIERQIDKANIAAELETQRQKNQWDADCQNFLDANKDLYTGEANKERFEALNETIMLLAKQPRNAGLTGPQLLAKAHTVTLAARGEAAPAAKEQAKPAEKKPIPKPALPPDLGAMPAASGNDPSEGKWASLDRLRDSGNGVAYEAALAKMSAADRDAYLAA